MADPFPLYLPAEARRLFQTESLLRRFAQMAHWDDGSRLLELYASLGGLALVRALGGELVVVEPEQKALDSVKDRAKAAGVLDQVSFEQHAVDRLDFPTGGFHGIFSFGRVLGTPGGVARAWRPLLAENGRVGMTCVVKVGRQAVPKALDWWQARLGQALGTPRDAALAIEAVGYEPEIVETAGEAELDEHYRELGALVAAGGLPAAQLQVLKDELATHEAGGKQCVTYAFVVARRKEPGEKPPPSRDSG